MATTNPDTPMKDEMPDPAQIKADNKAKTEAASTVESSGDSKAAPVNGSSNGSTNGNHADKKEPEPVAGPSSSTGAAAAVSPSKKDIEVVSQAMQYLAAGKRDLMIQDPASAVASLAQSCQLLGEHYGETAFECGEPYYYYGRALLDLARMEAGVIDNVLDGVPSDDESAPENSLVEDPEKCSDEEKVKVADDVDDALKENFETLEKLKKEKAEDEKKKKEDEQKAGEVDEKDGQCKSKPAKDDKAEAKSEKREAKDDNKEVKDEKMETNGEKVVAKDPEDKTEAKSNDEKKASPTKATTSADSEMKDVSANGEATKNGSGKKNKKESEEDEDDDEDEEEEKKSKEDGAGEESEEGAEGEENDEEEKDESITGDDKEATAEKDTGDAKAVEKEEEEDPSNLQLAWEMLELAKNILIKQCESLDAEKDKERKYNVESKVSDTFQTLGELSIENENYSQAIDDLTTCLERRKKLMPEDSRLIAETHYQLGVAQGFNIEFDAAVSSLNDAINVLQKRVDNLKNKTESKDPAKKNDAFYTREGEIKEIESLIPEIKEKIADTNDMKAETLKKLGDKRLLLEGAMGGSSSQLGEGSSSTAGESSSSSSKVSSISANLIKKRKKSDEAANGEGDAAKKPHLEDEKAASSSSNCAAAFSSSNGALTASK